jgi:type VI secretion system protein ImpL
MPPHCRGAASTSCCIHEVRSGDSRAARTVAMKPYLARLQTLANLAGGALLLWLAAPLLSIDGRHPFDGRGARAALLLALALVALLVGLGLQWRRMRRNASLVDSLQQGHGAAGVLSERFAHAMRLLRSGVGARDESHWWQRRRLVYQLPWYVFIGAPGAGKTTALLHSGLRFPLAERLGTAPVAGIGGTRQCDWWFTDQAVFIDTAGRYTTQDSHAGSDAQEWSVFMRLLRRYRPAQPINGVIVTVSVPDLLQGGPELEHQATAVDRRLQELRAELGLAFPVYLLVTKVDLLAGFDEFFGDFGAAEREQPWGVTFDPAAATGGMPPALHAQLAALAARVAAIAPRRLQQEPLLRRRAAIHHFPAQVEALLPALEAFAAQALRRCAEAPRQIVRGIHFSSGTQEGNPIDRVLGELGRSFGITLPEPVRAAGGGKAYFLATLLQQLVIAEAPLAGANLQRQRRQRWLAAGAGGALAGVLVLACVGWWWSYRHNAAYVDAVGERVRTVAQQIDVRPDGGVGRLLPLYALLSQLAAEGGVDPEHAPWSLDFGLFQGPRLARSADQTYHRVLDRTLAPLLAARLTQVLRQEADPGARYEALRVGLMLVTPDRLQRAEVRRWAAQAFGPPAGAQAPGAGEQQEWLRHVDALLERNAVFDVVRLDDATVSAARAALADVSLEQRVHDRLLRRARAQLGGERNQAPLASAAAVLTFAPPDAGGTQGELPALPVEYARRAWREVIEPAIAPLIAELADETEWVLGVRSPAIERLVRDSTARAPLARQLALRHAQASIAQWERLLGTLALQLPADSDSLARFATTLAAPQSPLRQLLRRIASEFAPAAAGSAGAAAALAYESSLGEHFGPLRDYAAQAGAAGGAVDLLLAPLPGALQQPATPIASALLRSLREEAARAPPPLRAMWTALADALGAQQQRAIERRLGGGMSELAQACRRLTADRFPFSREARRDMPYADFARVFAPHGLLDTFFRTHLANQVDTRHRPWRLTGEVPAPAKLQSALRAFEMADDIRHLFFPEGAELPQLRLQLTPVAMDSELLAFSADVDGQLLRYENGPRRPKALRWPGPAASQRVLLRILPAGPSGVGAEVHEGPWALLRVLHRRPGQRADAAGAKAQLEVDGRSLTLEVRTEGAVGAALLGELDRFQCPEAW